ncbi:T9SS type A sorting domain-containing protein [uncultured Flavobacterium sp.]|uniref:T9SS type A sorting domain-containing protein n=1 Tax=uncultured Flavobacterium sp. TaxID=165435 RepID=UPI0030CA5118
MKKLLSLILFFTFSSIFAQVANQPVVFNSVCDDDSDGFALFLMQEITTEITGNATNLSVTHYLNQSDAATSSNAISGNYTNETNPQLIFASVLNSTTNQVQIITYTLTVNPKPNASPLTITECFNNGSANASFNLNNASQIIWGQNQSTPNSEDISFYFTESDALNNMNVITTITSYFATSNPETLYYKVENLQTGCSSVSSLFLVSQNCNNPNCDMPTNLSVSNVTNNSATLSWLDSGSPSSWNIVVSYNGVQQLNTTITTNPFVLTGLGCNANYTFQVRAVCTETQISDWNTLSFQTNTCLYIGQASSLTSCIINGSACFNLTSNTTLVLGNLNPTDYAVSYHSSLSGANGNFDVIADPSSYCITTASETVYIRIQENATPANYQTANFLLYAETYSLDISYNVAVIEECDENENNLVSFDLTESEINMNNPAFVSYFGSLSDAENNISLLANPTNVITNLLQINSFIYARATYQAGTCDVIFKINLKAYASCNNAYVCSQANSLCSSLGQPFLNTYQGISAEAGNNYGCLNTQPNPTWFYLPVSQAGNLSFLIEQSTDINFPTLNLDVDFICYGPFTSPTVGCNAPLTSVVDCSYSASQYEIVDIPNALPGEYYLIMVTNYSGQAGYIRINQLTTSQGALDCSGLQLNAFIDINANGTQDTGEENFPLGTFSYELNSSGNNVNITSPFGEYVIYDDNATNSYNLSYAILPEYAAYYGISTLSYSNVSVVLGAGLQVYNFPVTITQTYIDVTSYIVPIQQPMPGFTYLNKIVYANLGNQVASGILTYTKDANVVITNVSQTGTVANTTGFTYDYTNLAPFEFRTINVAIQVPVIPTIQLGQLLTNTVSISPLAGDVVPLNNFNSSTQIVIGSYDPNDKMESRGNQIEHSTFTANDYLIYTIRFENTGTASAVSVRVEDMLDAKLDENSIRVLDASHAYTLERIGSSLIWYFENIQLPVSVANTPIGHGFITFKVKPKPGYAIGDIIPNTASIYFDFNPAIVTNTFETEFIAPLATSLFNEKNISVYPNPAKNQIIISLENTNELIANINIYDVLGKKVIQLNKINKMSHQIDVSALNSGIYFIELITIKNQTLNRKFIIK